MHKIYILFKEDDAGNIGETADLVDIEPAAEEEEGYLCSRCVSYISSPANIVEIDGSAEHSFTNPAGYMYHIICFRRAGGCVQTGHYERDFTWFPHYGWRYALCSSCSAHLGWHYTSPKWGGFYGLIKQRLIER